MNFKQLLNNYTTSLNNGYNLIINNIIYNQDNNHLSLTINSNKILAYKFINKLKLDILKYTNIEPNIEIIYHQQIFYNKDILDPYIQQFLNINNYQQYIIEYKIDNNIHIILNKEIIDFKDNLIKFLNIYSLVPIIKIEYAIESIYEQPIIIDRPINKPKETTDNKPLILIKDLNKNMENVITKGYMYRINKSTPKGYIIYKFHIHDYTSSITLKKFIKNEAENQKQIESYDNIKINKWYEISGKYSYDDYDKNYNIDLTKINQIDNPLAHNDIATKKRIEFHVHSNFSEMDGICKIEDLIDYAIEIGHQGFALLDHDVVQAYPLASTYLNKINKDKDFKLIYGVEMNMVESKLPIISKPIDTPINDIDYIVFDIETTGLSTNLDYIIEIGALKVSKGEIIDTFEILIKPPIPIPKKIIELTGIDNTMVKDSLSFKESIQLFLDFIQDDILIAHNANFDYDFINSELINNNLKPIDNPVIDTIQLSRKYLNLLSYKLTKIAKHYKIHIDNNKTHRSIYDSKILHYIFQQLLLEATNNKELTFNSIEANQDINIITKNIPKHISVIVKNQKGIKDLYKLISISHTTNLYVKSKKTLKEIDESTDKIGEPRILRSDIINNRDNLLIGSGCINSEIYEIAANKPLDKLKQAMAFYDYIEVFPLNMYKPFHNNSNLDYDIIKDNIKKIIDTAISLNKLVIASGDVHYIYKQQKQFRDLIIDSKRVRNGIHPLKSKNKDENNNIINPDCHYYDTNDMLEEFKWLNNEQLINDLVINNTHILYNQIDYINIMKNELYSPHLENAKENLTNICYQNAHRIYGEELPIIVKERLEKELKIIINRGYEFIYYVSHLLTKHSLDNGFMVGSRGSVGSSLVATFSNITEVNPLVPHYICNNCKYSIWDIDNVKSGFDLVDKPCPKCNSNMVGDGHNIPFETFLGFKNYKVPDIDLNFAANFQPQAHNYLRELLGKEYSFRAGTITKIKDDSAFGYVKPYLEDNNIIDYTNDYVSFLANGIVDIKKSTGKHPGGIIIIPNDMDIYDFTPVQYSANNANSTWMTTHFAFEHLHDAVMKFDILSHNDPVMMYYLHKYSDIDPKTIPFNDTKVISLFNSIDALNINDPNYKEPNAAVGLPEFGTDNVRRILIDAKPTCFADLVSISGLSHGENVWQNNAQDLILKEHKTLSDIITCRDDITLYLIEHNLSEELSFDISESVRKGRGLKEEWIKTMQDNKIPNWYIDSCKKIKYMFPKSHSVAYVIMSYRTAWYKLYKPICYYAAFFSTRDLKYEISTMMEEPEFIIKRLSELRNYGNSNNNIKDKKKIISFLEVVLEMKCRGFNIVNIDINKSLANDFIINPNDSKTLIPPFVVIDGLGGSTGSNIVEIREQLGGFTSKETFINKTKGSGISLKTIDAIELYGGFSSIAEFNSYTLF